MNKIYFDNSSTSFPKALGLGQVIGKFIDNDSFNINRGNYNKAYDVGYLIIETRELLLALFNYNTTKNVIFTSGITQSLNLVIKGLLKKDDHIITTSMEHNSVTRILKQLESKITVSEINGNKHGYINPDDITPLINDKTKAVIINHVSNVTGTIVDLKKVGSICKKNSLILIVDTAQSAGTIPIDMINDNIDILAFTGHKGLLAPQGIGGFIIKDDIVLKLKPLNVGGTGSSSDTDVMPNCMPDKFEAGTLNLPGIIGLNHSLKYLQKIGIDNIHSKELELAHYFIKNIKNIDNVIIHSDSELKNSCAVISISFKNIDNAFASFILDDEYGIMVRCGLHCAYKAHKTIGSYPKGTIRFSFGYWNTTEQIDLAVNAIKDISKR